MSGRRANDVCTECKSRSVELITQYTPEYEIPDYPLCQKCKRPFCDKCMPIHECKILRYKMVILVRKDLNMSVGKTSAQVGHAVADLAHHILYKPKSFYGEDEIKRRQGIWDAWIAEGGRKVVLGVEDDKELVDKYFLWANKEHLPTALVMDYGLTEIKKNTWTVLGIGPALAEDIDRVTGKLRTL